VDPTFAATACSSAAPAVVAAPRGQAETSVPAEEGQSTNIGGVGADDDKGIADAAVSQPCEERTVEPATAATRSTFAALDAVAAPHLGQAEMSVPDQASAGSGAGVSLVPAVPAEIAASAVSASRSAVHEAAASPLGQAETALLDEVRSPSDGGRGEVEDGQAVVDSLSPQTCTKGSVEPSPAAVASASIDAAAVAGLPRGQSEKVRHLKAKLRNVLDSAARAGNLIGALTGAQDRVVEEEVAVLKTGLQEAQEDSRSLFRQMDLLDVIMVGLKNQHEELKRLLPPGLCAV